MELQSWQNTGMVWDADKLMDQNNEVGVFV